MSIFVEIAAGELIDKITILEIKRDRIAEAGKRAYIRREYEQPDAARRAKIAPGATFSEPITAY